MFHLLLIMCESDSYHRWVLAVLVSMGLAWCILALSAVWSSCYGFGSKLAPSLTKEGLLKLRIGMTEQEVIKLIGPPLEKSPPWKGGQNRSWSWTYARTGFLGTGLELGVAIDDGHMVRAGAEINDLGVYLCTEEDCPKILQEEGLSCLPED